LRKATNPLLRFSPETLDEEEGFWAGGTAGAGAGAEAIFGCRETDDAGGADGAGAAVDAEGGGATVEADSTGAGEDVDDVEKSEKDEHPASSGISAIAAAVTAMRGTRPLPAIRRSTSAR
jgi:hypothetical protein